MSLAFVSCPVFAHRRGSGTGLHREHELVRGLYEDVRRWTGIDVEHLLRDGSADELADVAPVCQGLLVLAVGRVLAQRKITPHVVAGLSMGNIIAACLAGAVPPADLFTYLAATADAERMYLRSPREYRSGSPLGSGGATVVTIKIPFEEDPYTYCERAGAAGMYLVSDSGPAIDRKAQQISVGGRTPSAEAFIAGLPPDRGPLAVVDMRTAPHTPLRADYVAQTIDPLLKTMTFADPRIPVCSCLDGRTLTTAGEIRALFRDNHLRPASVPLLIAAMKRHGVGAYLMIGPSMLSEFPGWSVPSLHVEETEHVVEATRMLYELNIEVMPS